MAIPIIPEPVQCGSQVAGQNQYNCFRRFTKKRRKAPDFKLREYKA